MDKYNYDFISDQEPDGNSEWYPANEVDKKIKSLRAVNRQLGNDKTLMHKKLGEEIERLMNKISDHFKDHHYFTKEDFELLFREEYQAEVRRNIPADEGASTLNIDIIDLP